MKRKIDRFLNNVEEYAPSIAKEVANAFITKACDENIDYSFVIDRASGDIKLEPEELEPNTFFVFDTDEDMVLHEFKKALFDEDLNYIEEKSPEEHDLLEGVRSFLLVVCNIISRDYHDQLKETVRKVILGGKATFDKVPLDTIRVVSMDIADYSSIPESSKYLLKIGKKPGSDINTDEVICLVQSRQEKTGMDIDTIFSIEKKAGNPIFKNVEAIILGEKFLNEISIYFFIDYSVEQEEILSMTTTEAKDDSIATIVETAEVKTKEKEENNQK